MIATTADGSQTTADCDRLPIATGSLPFVLPVPGKDLTDVIAYRGQQGARHHPGGRVRAVEFKDGGEIPADLVMMVAGPKPSTALAEANGLLCQRGIVVSDTLQTTPDPRIRAVGERAAHRGTAYGLVAPLFEQGKVCATHLAQFGIGRYTGGQTSTKLKVSGIDLFPAGHLMGGPAEQGCDEIVLSDPFGGVYKKLMVRDDQLVGAVP